MKLKKVLSRQQQESIILLLTKVDNGMTMQEMADEVGVSTRTLYRWRKDPVYADELIKQSEELQRAFLSEAYAQLRAMVVSTDIADNNKLKAIELMLKNQGRLKEVRQQTVTVEESNRTFNDLLQELDELK